MHLLSYMVKGLKENKYMNRILKSKNKLIIFNYIYNRTMITKSRVEGPITLGDDKALSIVHKTIEKMDNNDANNLVLKFYMDISHKLRQQREAIETTTVSKITPNDLDKIDVITNEALNMSVVIPEVKKGYNPIIQKLYEEMKNDNPDVLKETIETFNTIILKNE